ncbi:MAG: RagB/SusD family nutrient uptake outer membrane protein [Chitinophagaceae bacterium]
MNRISKYIYSGAIAASCIAAFPSCKKSFLNEDLITSLNTQDFTTPTGIDNLVTGMYQSLKFHFNYEWAYSTTNYGTDEFWVGGDRTMQMWNSYDATLNSQTANAADIWDNMYANINSANIVIDNIPKYYGDGANKNTRLGEGYFMRAFDYFKLVKQYGGVPLKLTQTSSLEYEFPRSSTKDVYAQIISDFTKAYELLPTTPAQTGRITKWAAGHFLAKAYLFRASEINNDWNSDTKQADLQNAGTYAEAVINSGAHTLAPNFSDLWNFTTVDGANEKLSEVILAAQFSNNTTTQGRYGNQVHLYYPSVYQNLGGMVRDIAGGREFQRMRTSDYLIDVYDRVNDSRFWKSFKTRYLSNNPSGAPKWTAANAPSPDSVGKPKFYGGQESVLYIVNKAGDTRYTSANIGLRSPWMFVRYFNGENASYLGVHGNYEASRYPGLSKFADGSRNAVASQFGQRDGILARLAETYLIAAEAYGRLGQQDKALTYINKVRDRAAYKDGEDRSAYVDGGIAYKVNTVANTAAFVSYSDKNSYYESNNMTVTTGNTLSAMHINNFSDIINSTSEFYTQIGAGSDADKFIAFILNERSRELAGELMRWEDLARTKTLVTRATVFNNEAKPLAAKHYLRPIPQTFLDIIRQNGSPLTADQKQAMQNPGW